jgi:hypothetical protein
MEVVLISSIVPDVSVVSIMSVLSDILVVSNRNQYWAKGMRNKVDRIQTPQTSCDQV